MLDALIGGGASIASGILGYLESDKARGANKSEIARLQGLLDKTSLPEFDTSMITPEEYRVLEKYSPEIAPYVQEAAPETIKADSEGAMRGREAQMRALDRLTALGQTGEDTQSKILQDRALAAAAAQNQGQQEAIKQSQARRGMSGSGMELVQSLLAQQEGNRAAQSASQQAALDAYNRRLQSMIDSAALGEDIRNSDVNLETRNADIINDYNQRQAQRRQAYENAAADTRNKAQASNLDLAQEIAMKNIDARNAARTRKQDMDNDAAAKIFDAEMAKYGSQSGISQQKIGSTTQAAQDKAQMYSSIAGAIGSGGQAMAQSAAADRNAQMQDSAYKAKYGDKYKSIYG